MGRTPAPLPLARHQELSAICHGPFASLTTKMSSGSRHRIAHSHLVPTPAPRFKMTIAKETFHTEFNDPEGDLVIECKDGVKLRMQSFLLKVHR